MANEQLTIDPILLEEPRRIAPPFSWVGHIPFAFFLVKHYQPRTIVELGTHSGNSYFAFCQAVDMLDLPTKCFAVDTWQGDPQAGFYDESVYEDVFDYNQKNYNGFSTLLRKTFDEALADFEDGSIDLLHIDGLHTYEAVRHDFESWLPKMSTKGIILLHDTQVKKGDFGVWKFWEEISQKYSHFNFKHSHGLGIVQLSTNKAKDIVGKIKGDDSESLVRVFEILGNAIPIQNSNKINTVPSTNKGYEAKLYFNTLENKFDERNTLTKPITLNQSSIIFEKPEGADISYLRFDPVEDFVILTEPVLTVKLESGSQKTMAPTKSNLIKVDEPDIYFSLHKDPQFHFTLTYLDTTKIVSFVVETQYIQLSNNAVQYAFKRFIAKDQDKQAVNLDKTHFIEQILQRIKSKNTEEFETLKSEIETQNTRHFKSLKSEIETKHEKDTDLINDVIKTFNQGLKNTQDDISKDLKTETRELNERLSLLESRIGNLDINFQHHFSEQNSYQDKTFKKLEHKIENVNSQSKQKLESFNNEVGKQIKKIETKLSGIQNESENLKVLLQENALINRREKRSLRVFISRLTPNYKLIKNSQLFDSHYYLFKNKDVLIDGLDPVFHYLHYGWKENRKPSAKFDGTTYLTLNPDVAEKNINPLLHYVKYGMREKRPTSIPPVKSPKKIAKSSLTKPTKKSTNNSIDSKTKNKYLAGSVYDRSFYINKYKDVAKYAKGKKEKADNHWLYFGIKEGRIGSPVFDLNFYRDNYKDVFEYAGKDNFKVIDHYLAVGQKENRITFYHENSSKHDAYQIIRGKAAFESHKKNLVLIAHNASSKIYGGERSFLDIARSVDPSTFNLIIILPNANKIFLDLIKQYANEVVVFKYPWWKAGNEHSEVIINKFRTLFRQYRADLVHINTIMPIHAAKAAKKEGIPSLLHVREIISKDEELSKYIGLESTEITKIIQETSDHIIANSKITRKEFFKPEKTHLLYNTVDENLFSLEESFNQTLKVGMISSNIPKKGVRDFVSLANEMYKVNKDITFHLVGEKTELIEELEEEKALGKISPKLFFTGYVSSTIEAISELDVICNFSHFAESFGRTIAEGMAAGKVVIGYEWGALSELIDHEENGFLIPYRHSEKAISYILDMQTQRKKLSTLGQKAKHKAKKLFHPNSFATNLSGIYNTQVKYSNPLPFRPEDEDKFYSEIAENIPNSGKLLSTPKKIAYFLWHFPVPSETFVLNELRYLVNQGINVQVFCKGSPYKDFFPDFPIEITRVNTSDQLADHFIRREIEHVHAHFAFPTVTKMLWPACEKSNVSFTFIAHAQDIFRYDNMEVNEIVHISNSPLCLKIMAPGTFHRNFLVDIGVPYQKLTVNPQIVYKDYFQFNEKASLTKRVCAIGRFVEKKGFEYLIRAAKYLSNHKISIHIYGYGDLSEKYHEIIKEQKVHNIFIEGKLENSNEVSQVLRKHDILIQPSLVAQNGDMDGVPTVLMEAMSSGTLVLSTKIASIPDLISDGVNGFLLHSIEPSRIAEKILSIYQIPLPELHAIAVEGKKQIDKYYNIEKNVQHLIDIWKHYTIDIILVTYVNEKYSNFEELKEVINRIYTYTSLSFNLYIIDNGSDSRTTRYLESLDSKLDNLHFHLQNENLFVGGGTNVALNLSNSEFAFYICAVEGFILENGWEIDAITYLRNNPNVGLAGTLGYSPTYFTGYEYTIGISLFQKFRNQNFAKINPDRPFKHVQGGLIAIRRSMYREIGGFNPEVPHQYTDVEYSYYAESCGWELGKIPSWLSLYEKTRPGLLSRFDEMNKVIHPGLLDYSNEYQSILQQTTNICNICEWKGKAFHFPNQICPKCNSTIGERTQYRLLCDSDITFRNINMLFIGSSESTLLIEKLGRMFHLKTFMANMHSENLNFQIKESQEKLEIIVIKVKDNIDQLAGYINEIPLHSNEKVNSILYLILESPTVIPEIRNINLEMKFMTAEIRNATNQIRGSYVLYTQL